jgi:hypothetical protein
LGDVATNLKGVIDSLHAWSGHTIGSIDKRLERKRKEMDKVYSESDANIRKLPRN